MSLHCPHCWEGWRLVSRRGGNDPDVRPEVCQECGGTDTVPCDEPGCIEAATHIFCERGHDYPLCERHFAVWCADAAA